MKHIEEHILEKYLINPNSDAITQSDGITREQIEQHLIECHGCSETVERIRLFYSNLDARLENIAEDSVISTQSLTKIEQSISTNIGSDLQAFEELPITFWGKIVYSTKKHPIAAGSSALVLFSFSALLLMTLLPEKKDLNPEYPWNNYESDLVEIRNKNNELLWKYPVENLRNVSFDFQSNANKQFILDDIDGDGKKEFVACRTIPKNDVSANDALHVFNYDGTERFHYIPSGDLNFRGRKYKEKFFTRSVETFSIPGTHEKLIILISSCGRSPAIVSILDFHGTVRGEFFHFGNLASMTKDTLSNGTPVIFLCGSSDIIEIEQHTYSSFGVIDIIDPTNLQGKSESHATKGFGYPSTDAELYYLRFPWSDIDLGQQFFRSTAKLGNKSEGNVIIKVAGGKDTVNWDFDYTFDRSLVVQDVKASDGTFQVHKSLKIAGKLNSTIDAAYLQNLKKRVEYWDGRAWKTQPSVIMHF